MLEHQLSAAQSRLNTAELFLRRVSLRSEAYLQGDDWVRSKLADLKIDLWLATEHGEATGSEQVEWIHHQIDVYKGVLCKTVFDPDPSALTGSLAIEAAAADLVQYVLQIAKQKYGVEKSFDEAEHLLTDESARSLASDCLERVAHYKGILMDDTEEILKTSLRLLSQSR